MENCYNMMTIMSNIGNRSIILSMLGFGGLFVGAFYLFYNEILASVDYMTTSISSLILVSVINKIHVAMSIQSSNDTLELENDELTMTINNCKKKENM